MQEIDEKLMRRALELACRGRGCVHPNPLVGAVLAVRGRILSEGWHRRFGGRHAEVEALRKFRKAPRGATLYVTLEPCGHFGKTPPCADFLLQKKVRRLVIGSRDANPAVSGRGLRKLRRAGVRIVEGVLREEASALNRDVDHWTRCRAPYVTVKTGQSLDGAIATASGYSKWITSPASRRRAMEVRAHADAVLVGVRTVLRDDPRLTVRPAGFHGNPLKIVLDPGLRTPPRAKIFSRGARVLLVAAPGAPRSRRRVLSSRAEILTLSTGRGGRFSWKTLLGKLGRRGIVQVLIEGGGETIGGAFDAGVVNEVHAFIAPTVLGGANAVRSVAGRGVLKLAFARRFKKITAERIGNDLHYMGIF